MSDPPGYLLLVSFKIVRLATVLLGAFKTFKTNIKLFIQAPVHGSPIPDYITREGYIARLTYPQRLCSLYGGLWASRVTLRCLPVSIQSEEGWFPLLSSFVENWQFWSGCVFVMKSSWMVGAYTPSRSVLLWDWGGCEVNRVRKLHRGWAWRLYGLMPASIVLEPRWTTDWVIHCTAYFHFQLIMNQLVPKLIQLCQENRKRF